MNSEICRKCFGCDVSIYPRTTWISKIDKSKIMVFPVDKSKINIKSNTFCVAAVVFNSDGFFDDFDNFSLTDDSGCPYYLEHFMHDVLHNKITRVSGG